MAKKLIVSYDKKGDVLDLSLDRPRKAVSDEVEDDIFVRIDPQSREVVGFMILNFSKRFAHKKESTLPVTGEFAFSR